MHKIIIIGEAVKNETQLNGKCFTISRNGTFWLEVNTVQQYNFIPVGLFWILNSKLHVLTLDKMWHSGVVNKQEVLL